MKSSTAFEPQSLFIDTWGWLVLADRNDPAYGRVAGMRRKNVESRRPWVTTDYVLDETITRLFAAAPFAKAQEFCDAIFASRDLGSLVVEYISPERFRTAYQLRLRYKDKSRISFTDLTSFAVMHELGIRDVLTGDEHFVQIGLGFRKLP